MNTSYLRQMSMSELEKVRSRLWGQLRSASGEELRAIQVDICWIQKVQQEYVERKDSVQR